MSTQGLKGLKTTAEATVLADIKVTSELKAKLKQRIEHAENQGIAPVRPHRPWLRPAGYAAAAAAVVTLALLAGKAPMQTLPPAQAKAAEQPVPLPPPYQQMTTSNGPAKMVLTAKVADGHTGSVSYSTESANVLALDQNGSTIPQAITQQSATEAQPGRKIITNGEYGLRVQDARGAVDRLQRDALAAGGYVAEATVNKEANGSWVGRVVLRVPANTAVNTIQNLSQIGIVERERQWTQDVSDQWMDLEHRIAIQKEHEKRLRELAEKASTFDDWNKLATQINNTRVETENLTGRLKLLSNQVEFAILNIQVVQPAPGQVPVSKGATTFSGQMGEAFSNSVRYIVALSRQVVVGLAAMTPFALALLPLAVAVVLIRRRRRTERG